MISEKNQKLPREKQKTANKQHHRRKELITDPELQIPNSLVKNHQFLLKQM